MWLGTCIGCDWKISTTQFVKCNVCFGPGGHDSITLAASDADEKYWHVRINNCPTPAATHVFIWRVGVCAWELVLPWIWVSQMNTDMILSGKNISVTWHASQLNWFICRSNISTRTVFFPFASLWVLLVNANRCEFPYWVSISQDDGGMYVRLWLLLAHSSIGFALQYLYPGYVGGWIYQCSNPFDWSIS